MISFQACDPRTARASGSKRRWRKERSKCGRSYSIELQGKHQESCVFCGASLGSHITQPCRALRLGLSHSLIARLPASAKVRKVDHTPWLRYSRRDTPPMRSRGLWSSSRALRSRIARGRRQAVVPALRATADKGIWSFLVSPVCRSMAHIRLEWVSCFWGARNWSSLICLAGERHFARITGHASPIYQPTIPSRSRRPAVGLDLPEHGGGRFSSARQMISAWDYAAWVASSRHALFLSATSTAPFRKDRMSFAQKAPSLSGGSIGNSQPSAPG